MALDPLDNLDLSELPDYDAEQEYRALLRALRRQEGFGIIFVRCSPDQGRKLVEDLKQDLPRKRCTLLTIAEPLPDGDFFDQAATSLKEHPADVVFVEGIEHSLLDYEETKRQSGWSAAESQGYSWKGVPPLLRNLNQQRDRFRNELPSCFVFLVPLFLVRYLTRRAPDFFDWRSGVFEFRDAQDSILQKIQDCFLNDYEKVQDLTPSERVWQAIRIRDLLDESTISPDKRFRLLIDHGVIRGIDGSLKDAQISWDKALNIPVTTADNLNLKGRILAALNRHEEAITSYDQALTIKPDDHQVWYNRGIVLNNLGRYEEAITSYGQAIIIKPDDYQSWHNRGGALSSLGRYEEAIASFDNALGIKADDSDSWCSLGASYFLLQKYEEAIASLNKSLQLKPEQGIVWCLRGGILEHLERYEEAISSYDRALEIKPDYHEVWNNRGILLKNLGRYEEAIAAYDQALAIKSDDHEALFNKGNALSALGRKDEAIAAYGQALAIKPDLHNAFASRGDVYRRLSQPQQARADLNRAIELKPDYDWAIAARGQTYAQLQQYETALQDLDRAIEINPEYTWAIGYRGELYLWLQRYEDAIAVFNQTLQKNPKSDWTHCLRALALAKTVRLQDIGQSLPAKLPSASEPALQDLTEAIQLAQASYEKDSSNWQNNFNLALYHLAAGHYPEAQTLYEAGLNAAPAWAISMAHRDLQDYLRLFPSDKTASHWCDRIQVGWASLVPRLRLGMPPRGSASALAAEPHQPDTQAEPGHQVEARPQRALCTEQPHNTSHGPFKISHP